MLDFYRFVVTKVRIYIHSHFIWQINLMKWVQAKVTACHQKLYCAKRDRTSTYRRYWSDVVLLFSPCILYHIKRLRNLKKNGIENKTKHQQPFLNETIKVLVLLLYFMMIRRKVEMQRTLTHNAFVSYFFVW